MQWTLCLYPQSRHDASDPTPSQSFELRLQEIIASFDDRDHDNATPPQLKHANHLIERLLHSMSSQFSMVGQPSSRQLTRFWFLRGEIKLALGDRRNAMEALDCCAGLVAQNPLRDQIAVTFLRAQVAGSSSLFRLSMEGYGAVIEHLDHISADDFCDGDLESLRCYAHLQRAQHYLALGYFDYAQADMAMATDMLDHALAQYGAPRREVAGDDENPAMHPALIDYATRLRGLAGHTVAATNTTTRNWLHLSMEVPATYAAVEMWHTRLCAQERRANGLLQDFYALLVACGDLSTALPTWADFTTLLYYRAAEVAIMGHDVAYILLEQGAASEQTANQHAWLQRADQALVNVFGEQDQHPDAIDQDAVMDIELERHGLWLRQQYGQLDDFPQVPDLIEIGNGVRQLLQQAIAQGKLWSAACCNHLLGYIAMALNEHHDAHCCLQDALTLFEQAHGDAFYPRQEELRRAIASLNL